MAYGFAMTAETCSPRNSHLCFQTVKCIFSTPIVLARMAARDGVATFRSHAPSHRMSTNILPCKSANKKYYGKTYTEKNPDAKKHGFDEPKLNTPCALFYMPCQSGFGDSFFLEFVHGKRQFLNPYNVVTNIPKIG